MNQERNNMKYLLYENNRLVKYSERKQLIKKMFEENSQQHQQLFDYLKTQYELLNQKFLNYFNYEDEKFFFFYKIYNQYEYMIIEPTIIINYQGEIAKRIIKNLKKEFLLESFEILREDFLLKSGKRVDFQLKVKDINDMDISIANNYIDNPIIQQLKDFNNKVIHFVHDSQTQAQLLDVSRYLSCDVNYLREIELAKTEEIRKVLSVFNNFNNELSHEVSTVANNEGMDLHSLLIEKYDVIKNFDCYDLLMNSINNQIKTHEIINFNRDEVKAYFMSDGYYIYQGKMNLIVYEVDRLNAETVPEQ